MADDPHKRDYRDRDRVNVNEPYELEYWSNKWGVSHDRLKQAEKKVGPMVKDIQKELGR